MQYGVKIFVITSFKETYYIEILPNVEKSQKGSVVVYSSFLLCLYGKTYTAN